MRFVAMTPEEQERLQACTQEIAEILYRNTDKESLTNLDAIEQTVRQQMLEHVSPEVALFLSTVKPVLRKDESAL
jgi:maltodextrin utilization protein YvdJ